MVPGDDRDDSADLAPLRDGPAFADHDDDRSWERLHLLVDVLLRASQRLRLDAPAPQKAVNVFHYWDQPEPPGDVATCMASWRRGDLLVRSFDHDSADEYLRYHYGGDVLAAFRYAHHPAMQADLLRMARLYRDGGLYVDADDRYLGDGTIPSFRAGSALVALAICRHCPASLSPRPGAAAGAAAGAHAWNYLGNAPWFSQRGHPLVACALDRAVATVTARRQRGERTQIHRDVGPGCVSMAALDYARACLREGRAIDLSVSPGWAFLAQSEPLGYKATERNWRRNAVLYGPAAEPADAVAAN